jgi:hypothetical protein
MSTVKTPFFNWLSVFLNFIHAHSQIQHAHCLKVHTYSILQKNIYFSLGFFK